MYGSRALSLGYVWNWKLQTSCLLDRKEDGKPINSKRLLFECVEHLVLVPVKHSLVRRPALNRLASTGNLLRFLPACHNNYSRTLPQGRGIRHPASLSGVAYCTVRRAVIHARPMPYTRDGCLPAFTYPVALGTRKRRRIPSVSGQKGCRGSGAGRGPGKSMQVQDCPCNEAAWRQKCVPRTVIEEMSPAAPRRGEKPKQRTKKEAHSAALPVLCICQCFASRPGCDPICRSACGRGKGDEGRTF